MHSEQAALGAKIAWDPRGTNGMPCDDVERDARVQLREVPALSLKTCDCSPPSCSQSAPALPEQAERALQAWVITTVCWGLAGVEIVRNGELGGGNAA